VYNIVRPDCGELQFPSNAERAHNFFRSISPLVFLIVKKA
jgi:hypothetical protein